MTEYLIYYTDKSGESEGYCVYGIKRLRLAIKYLQSDQVCAEHIEIYKKGPNFEDDHDNVMPAQLGYWK